MKARLTRLAFLVVAIAFLPAFLCSQMLIKTPLFRVDVPFAFMAGGVHLPAGPYIVSHLDPFLIQIEAQDGKARALVHVAIEDINYQTRSKLTFHRYGDQYFLAHIWTAHDHQAHHCRKCRAERALEARANRPEQTTVLAYK